MITIISRQPLPDSLSPSACKAYLRIFDNSHDRIIALMRDAAVRAIENYTRQRFQIVTVEQSFEPQSSLTLLAFPILSINTVTINGTGIDSEIVDLIEFDWLAAPTTIDPPAGHPNLFLDAGIVRYTCGWATWPEDVVLLVLEKLGESFENRKATGPTITNQFTKAHAMVLENYASHYDAIR